MTDDATAIDLLLAIRYELAAAGSPRAEWFTEHLDRWLAGDVKSLDKALGVAAPGPGSRTAIQAHFEQQRDENIRKAYDEIQGPTQTERVQKLDQHIRTMEGKWDELRALEGPDDSWPVFRTALWWAFTYKDRTGRPMPGYKRLCAIIAWS